MDKVSCLEKKKTLNDRGNFQYVKNWKNVKFDFHMKFYKPIINN